jgi:hypothetical protein
MAGVRTVANVGAHLANISFDRSHNLLASATHTMDIYRDASERSADGIQALFSSCMAMPWLATNAAHMPRNLRPID